MTEQENATALIKEKGIYGLGGNDGCACTNFSIHSIDVSVSCHRSEQMVRVSSATCGVGPKDLTQVAHEAKRQAEEFYYSGEDFLKVRLCDYSHDNPPKCIYCGKSREALDGYLCNKCQCDPDIKSRYEV